MQAPQSGAGDDDWTSSLGDRSSGCDTSPALHPGARATSGRPNRCGNIGDSAVAPPSEYHWRNIRKRPATPIRPDLPTTPDRSLAPPAPGSSQSRTTSSHQDVEGRVVQILDRSVLEPGDDGLEDAPVPADRVAPCAERQPLEHDVRGIRMHRNRAPAGRGGNIPWATVSDKAGADFHSGWTGCQPGGVGIGHG